MPWFRELSAEERSWVGAIVQAGIRGFVDWYRTRRDRPPGRLAAGVRGLRRRAPRADRGDQPPADGGPDQAEHRGGGGERRRVPLARRLRRRARRGAALRPRGRLRDGRGLRPRRRGPRSVGRASRGPGGRLGAALGARRGGPLPGERARLGRPGRGRRGAGRGSRPSVPRPTSSTRYAGRARAAGMDALCATQGERLVVVLGGVGDPRKAAERGGRPVRPGAGRGRAR